MMAVAYRPPQSGIPVGAITLRILRAKGISQKEAAIVGGCREATLSKGLAGLGPLDLHAVMCWPLPAIFKLFRTLLAAKLAQWETDAIQERKIS